MIIGEKRSAEWRDLFVVEEVNGSRPIQDVIAQTLVEHVNEKHGRPVLTVRPESLGINGQ